MIEKLTPKQESEQLEVRDYWINKVYSCEKTDEEYSKKLIEYLYKLANLEKPKVVFADSPLSAQLVIHVLKTTNTASVEDSVWASVWDSVWASVEDSVWASVRDSVWASVMASVWASVWASVGDSVRDSVRDSVWDSVWASVEDSVWASVRDSVWASVMASVWASVWASVGDSVRDSVRDSVGASVEDSVWASVRDSVRDSELKYSDNLIYGEAWGYGWQAFYDFFTRRTGLVQHEVFKKYIELVDKANAYYIIPFKNVCVVTRNPSYIHKTWHNDRWVMHDDEGNLAIKWRDGWGQYVLHGITLKKEMYDKILSKEAAFAEVMANANMEHRMLFLKYLDADKLLKGANAELIGRGKRKTVHFDYSSSDKLGARVSRNELFLIKGLFAQDEYFLRYEDPSTGRVYISCIDPEVGKTKDADMCMAWKLGLSKKMYMELKLES